MKGIIVNKLFLLQKMAELIEIMKKKDSEVQNERLQSTEKCNKESYSTQSKKRAENFNPK